VNQTVQNQFSRFPLTLNTFPQHVGRNIRVGREEDLLVLGGLQVVGLLH